MGFQGIYTNKLNGRLGGQEPSEDGVGMLIYGIATADMPVGTSHFDVIECLQPSDLEVKGFDAAFDAAEKVLIHNEVSDFFAYSPSGKLYVVPVPVADTIISVLQNPLFRAALRNFSTTKFIGIAHVEASAGALITEADCVAAANNVQLEINKWKTEDNILIDFVCLAANGASPALAVSAYTDLRTLTAPNVCISIAQDDEVASLDPAYANYAAIGSVLGMRSVRKVSECIASVDIEDKPDAQKAEENYTLTRGDRWKNVNLSSGVAIKSLSNIDVKALADKGYIFAAHYDGYPGNYLSTSATCIALSSDYSSIENNGIWNKSARLIRTTLIPRLKSKVPKEPTTGFIKDTVISSWVGLLNKKVIERMQNDGDIDGGTIYINPKQLPSVANPVKVQVSLVISGIVHEFSVDIGLTNNI